MTDPMKPTDWASHAHDNLTGDRRLLPGHAVRKLGSFLQGRDVVYGEVRLDQERAPHDPRSGQVVVFTKDTLLRLVLTSTPERPSGSESTVQVEVAARSSLVSIEQVSGEIGEDYAWSMNDTLWTDQTRLRLRYRDGTEITLPLDPSRAASRDALVMKLLPGLLRDLAAP